MNSENPKQTIGFLLHDIARLMRRNFDRRAHDLGLTRAQWQVLAHLARHEGISQAALAEILEVEPITLTRQIDRLEGAELVERRANPDDRRAHRLYVTPKARPVLARMWVLGAETREEAMAGLTAEQREQLIESLLAIRANLSAHEAPAQLERSEA